MLLKKIEPFMDNERAIRLFNLQKELSGYRTKFGERYNEVYWKYRDHIDDVLFNLSIINDLEDATIEISILNALNVNIKFNDSMLMLTFPFEPDEVSHYVCYTAFENEECKASNWCAYIKFNHRLEWVYDKNTKYKFNHTKAFKLIP